jgi:hypothetical protein
MVRPVNIAMVVLSPPLALVRRSLPPLLVVTRFFQIACAAEQDNRIATGMLNPTERTSAPSK